MPDGVATESKITLQDIDNAPDQVGSTPTVVSPDSFAALQDRFTEVSNENFRLKLEKDELIKRVNTTQTLDALMAPYAAKAYWFMVSYCGFAGFVLLRNASHVAGFTISDGVLEILIGSTAVTVIGLVGMVLTGIFVGARPKA